MRLVLIGVSHHTAPVEVRERLSFREDEITPAVRACAAATGAGEVALLSTCNRLELYAAVASGEVDAAAIALRREIARLRNVSEEIFEPHLYLRIDEEAALHLMRVASGLDSMIRGEGQILGQVRDALRVAQESDTAGPYITGLFQESIACGRRVRTETGLGKGAFSIGHAAVELARSIFADLRGAGVMVLGAGKMSEITVRHLIEGGVKDLVVANRTHDRATRMAAQLGGKAVPYESFVDHLATADIVIASTSAPHFIVRRETLQPILRKRRGRPLFLIDIAVPRDVDPEVARLDNVFLKDIDDLQSVVMAEGDLRAADAGVAEQIAESHAARFTSWFRGREAVPVINGIQGKLEGIRQADLAILKSRLPTLTDREWQMVESATRAMMKRAARDAVLRLKRETDDPARSVATPARYDLLSAARELFGLDPGEGERLDYEDKDDVPNQPTIGEAGITIGVSGEGSP